MSEDRVTLAVRMALALTVTVSWGAGLYTTMIFITVLISAFLRPEEQLAFAGLGALIVAVRTVPCTLLAMLGLYGVRRFEGGQLGPWPPIIAVCTATAPIASALSSLMSAPIMCAFSVLELPLHLVAITLGMGASAAVLHVAALRASDEGYQP